MPKTKPDVSFDSLRNEIAVLFDEAHHKIEFVVSEAARQKEIALLKETLLNNDRFFFVVNLLNFEMEEPHGINKWLGYSEREFSLRQYWEKVVHPGRKQSLLLIVKQMYQSLCTGTYPLEFMVQRFSTIVPLKHYNGHYVLTKKTASVFQFDVRNRLTAYMDEFTIISHNYNGEPLPLSPVMYNVHGQLEIQKEKEIMAKAMEQFIGMKVFTLGELQTIRLLAYDPLMTQAKIAKHLKRSPNTIDTYYKRFLVKARNFFGEKFPSVLDAALYLKREGLL